MVVFIWWASAKVGCMCVCACMLRCFSCIWLSAISWTVAHQTPLSVGFSRQEYWSGLSFPFPRDPPDPGIEPVSPMAPTLARGFFFTTEPPGKPLIKGQGLAKMRFFPSHGSLANILQDLRKERKRKEHRFVVFAYLCGGNILTWVSFKLLIWLHWMLSWEDTHIISFWWIHTSGLVRGSTLIATAHPGQAP